MEKVQFQLESTLPELKDLYDKGLFSKASYEIDQITKRRTAFETALIRRVTRKDDFFKYAEYEINLERLRKVRWKKLKYHINPPPPSASTFSLPRRTLYILKRATAKFPGDLPVWLAYVEYAAREGMSKVVAKGINSALQHHPLSPTLYLLQSYHHLHPGEPLPHSIIPSTSTLDLPSQTREDKPSSAFSLEGTGPARTTLLLGLRMIPGSHTLWREYVKLELGWVEALRRRWRVLGIASKPAEGNEAFDGDVEALAGGEGAFGPEGEDARRAILSGQLVVHALESALAKVSATGHEKDENGDIVSGIAFREGLLALLRSYPSPLRTKAQEVVYADLERVAEGGGEAGAQARVLLLSRPLLDRAYNPDVVDQGGLVVSGLELVDAYGKIGKEIRSAAKTAGPEFLDEASKWLVARIAADIEGNDDLRRYLIGTAKALTKASLRASPATLNRYLALLADTDSAEYSAAVREFAKRYPSSSELQARLIQDLTTSDEDAAAVRKACADAVAQVTRSQLDAAEQETVIQLWKFWARWEDRQENNAAQWKRLLRDSLRLGAGIPALHQTLLADFYASQLRSGTAPGKALDTVIKSYQPTPLFFDLAFDVLDELNGTQEALGKLYGSWRAACRTAGDRVEAVLVWAQWLVEHAKGRAAHDAVGAVLSEVKGDDAAAAELEAGWKEILDEAEREREDVDEDVDMSGSGSEDEEEEEEQEGEEAGEGEDDDSEDDDEDAESGDLEIAM
ncbi:U3 snoRNP protein [Vanrija albida]|uniref:U3 snoRNP protein n=1 Tax=Vanrija albida TaxID=181172 RepID=A0ABR3Q8B8_9TREE